MTWGKDSASRARGPFEDEWPDLARGLDRALRGRHVPAPRREDIIQDTGLRLFIRWPSLDPDRPLWPFALTIAMNLLKDEQRMQARRYASAPHVDEMVERGVEEEALARLELTDVQLALQKLTPAQRSVLLADIGAAPYDDRGPAALKMLRMRARRTLRTVIDRASALLPLATLKWRRASSSIATTLQRNTGVDQGQSIALSTLGIAGAVTILGATFATIAPAGSLPGVLGDGVLRTGTRAAHAGASASISHGARREGLGYAGAAATVRGRTQALSHKRHSGARRPAAAADIEAGGTGIDEDPSLTSDNFRVWVFARGAAAGQEAIVDYEVRQRNPVCGSPMHGSRTCVRAEAPSARGRSRLVGQGTDDLSPR